MTVGDPQSTVATRAEPTDRLEIVDDIDTTAEPELTKERVGSSTARTVDVEVLRQIEQRVLWLATRIIDNANRREGGEIKVGGHQASCASMVSIMTALWFGHIGGEDKVAIKPHASPVYHAIKYLTGELDRQVGDPDLPTLDFAGGAALARATIDTLDSVRFPRRGGLLRLEGQFVSDALGSDESIVLFEGQWSYALSFGKNTLIPNLKYATSWAEDSDLDTSPIFSLGGFLKLSGLVADQRTGPHLVFGSLVGYRRVANPRFLMLALPVYVGGSIEAGNTFESVQAIRARELTVAGSVFLGIDTPLGPLYIGYGAAEGGHDSGYLRLGQVF